MKSIKFKSIFVFVVIFSAFAFSYNVVYASYSNPQTATAKYRYSQYQDISVVYLNKPKATALANKFVSSGSVSSQTWAYALSLIPYFGQVYGFSEFCSGAMKTITAASIRQKLRTSAGVRIETWRPRRGMGGGIVSIVYGWNGKRSGITGPKVPAPKYLTKYKGFYIKN